MEGLPEKFVERLRRVIPAERWDAVAGTFSQPRPTTFRVNGLKTTRDEVHAQLSDSGFRLEDVGWYPGAFVLREGRLRDLQDNPLYLDGSIYVQSLSSMIPALILDPQPGEEVLDLTAAPGSKTTQMACLMRGEGRIVANDNNRARFYKLQANITRQAAANVELTRGHGEAVGKRHPGRFDRVLLDAPCSTEGRFQTQDPATYRYWKPMKIREMVRKQQRLMQSAIAALKPGGVLVYSTCTFAPEENEAVVNRALEKHGTAIAVEAVAPPVANVLPGLLEWEGRLFHPALSRAVRVLPTLEMEGFFVVRIRKLWAHGRGSTGRALPRGTKGRGEGRGARGEGS